MKSSELIGKRVTLHINGTPCRVTHDNSEHLTKNETGVFERFLNMPGGPIGFLQTDDKRRIAFDAGFDFESGKIEVEFLDN